MTIWYAISEIWYMMNVSFISHFGIFLSFLPPRSPIFLPTAWKSKLKKRNKKHLGISSFYIYVPKIMIIWCTIPEIWSEPDGRIDASTGGRTDERKKWNVEVGALPKKFAQDHCFMGWGWHVNFEGKLMPCLKIIKRTFEFHTQKNESWNRQVVKKLQKIVLWQLNYSMEQA